MPEGRRGRVVRAVRLWRRKSPYRVSSRLGFVMRRLENSLCQPRNGYLFRIREGSGSERRGMGSTFHQLCPIYSGTHTPTAPKANRLWENFTFFITECGTNHIKDNNEKADRTERLSLSMFIISKHDRYLNRIKQKSWYFLCYCTFLI